ncbi:MAG TPA: hypothetical protein VHW24_10820 [Bryobacteraceae bacterium]|nr:hypothetical protein [Bryobacteraceae bacterium]
MRYSPAEYITLILGTILVALAAAIGYRTWKASRISPEEVERRRRAVLVAQGKINDAQVVEFRDGFIFYSYAVGGVEYTASQDLTFLPAQPPKDFSSLSVSVRYDPRNPANSIVAAEQWSGLRN